MTTNLMILIICAIMIGLLGISSLIFFIFLGGESIWFQATAVAHGAFSAVMTISLIVMFIYILIENN